MKRSGLKPSQVCDLLQVSASTLRAWSVAFGEHLSPEARGSDGHHRAYLPSDVATLQRASVLLQTHTMIEAGQLLGLADDTDQGALVLASLPAIAGELQALRDAMMLLRSDVAALQAARQADQAEIERLRGEVAGLFDRQRKRQAALETDLADVRAQLADLQARRHWWQRLRKP